MNMAQTQDAPQQYKQSSRKGKKAWRKNVDISDVQTGLEHLRDEVVTGGPIAEKPSEDIFSVDTRGSEAIRKSYKKTHKLLKADEILARRSEVPALDSRKRLHGRITDGIIDSSHKKHKSNWVGRKEVQRLRGTLNERSHLSSGRLDDGENSPLDLWSEDQTSKEDFQDSYIEQPKAKVIPPTIRRAPIAMAANGKRVKAVRTPTAGTSYNPSFTDWDDLLRQEGEKAVEAEKKRLRNEQLEAEREARIAAIQIYDAQAGRTDEESAWEGFQSDYDNVELVKKKMPGRKNQAERNKIKRRKEAERQALHQSKMANRKTQARQLEQLALEGRGRRPSDGGHLVLADSGEVSSDDGDDSVLRRKSMRHVSIPEKNLEVVLPDELQDSLRRLKPEGSLLDDRFRHLLVNGKIEARRPAPQPKKRKFTYTEKWTHKDFRISV